MNWETIDTENKMKDYPQTERYSVMRRTKVPNGWLVESVVCDFEHVPMTSSITFVSDPNHEWDL